MKLWRKNLSTAWRITRGELIQLGSQGIPHPKDKSCRLGQPCLAVTRQACGLFEKSHGDKAASARRARAEHQELKDGSGGAGLILMQSKMDSYCRDLRKECHDGRTGFQRWCWLLSRENIEVGQEHKWRDLCRGYHGGLPPMHLTSPMNFWNWK